MIKWSDKAKKLGKNRADSYSKYYIPNEELIYGSFGYWAFFPGNFGVKDVGQNSGKTSRNKL